MKISVFLLAAALFLGIAWTGMPVYAKEGAPAVHAVEMLNKGDEGNMVFKPAVVFAKVGDTIRFTPTSTGHNAETFPDMVPKGGTPFATEMSKPADVTVNAEGVWGYFCKPHASMGMVGLIVVGGANLKGAVISEKASPLAKKRFQKYIAESK